MTTKNKKLIKIGVIALAVIFFLICTIFVIDSVGPANPKAYKKFLLSTFNGSYTAEGLPETYWQIEPKEDENGVRVPTYAKFSLTTVDTDDVGEIWVNLSDLKESAVKITIGYGYSEQTFKTAGTVDITSKQIKESENGWFKIYDAKKLNGLTSFTSKHVWIGFENSVRVREINFKDVNGKAPEKVELKGMSINATGVMDANKLSKFENNVNNVCDEQKKFKI